MIRTARATEEELGLATPASVQKWARCHLTSSERDVQRVVKAQRLALPLPLTKIEVRRKKFPFIRSIDWLNFIVCEAGQWHRLAGLNGPNPEKCATVWSSFWRQYRQIEPDHQVFSMLTDDELSRTAACYFHLDEGRGYKRTAVMIMSFHSCLGFGFRNQVGKKRKRAGEQISFLVNYTGATLTNRFLLSVIPKMYYDKSPLVINDVFDLIAQDFKACVETGVQGSGGQVYRLCILGVKADWPAQVRCGGLLRSYNRGPKKTETKTANAGVCHLCEAGLQGIPYEEIGLSQPRWSYTLGASLPWRQTPELLQHLPHNPSFPASFFCIDIWHTVHAGVGKSFISSAIVLALDLFPERGIDSKLERATNNYFAWCRLNGVQPYLARITKDTITWKKQSDEPAGAWNKGNVTSLLCRWFEALCAEEAGQIQPGSMLDIAGQACAFLNRFLRVLYKTEVFIEKTKGLAIADDGRQFLRLYRVLAERAFGDGRQLFPLLPKIHSLDHITYQLSVQCRVKGLAWNPLIMGNQMEEDFIGRPSRISRRVSPRMPATRTIQRYLIAARTAWRKAGMID